MVFRAFCFKTVSVRVWGLRQGEFRDLKRAIGFKGEWVNCSEGLK